MSTRFLTISKAVEAVLQEGGTRFADEIRDIVQYRVLEYYWKRYRDKV